MLKIGQQFFYQDRAFISVLLNIMSNWNVFGRKTQNCVKVVDTIFTFNKSAKQYCSQKSFLIEKYFLAWCFIWLSMPTTKNVSSIEFIHPNVKGFQELVINWYLWFFWFCYHQVCIQGLSHFYTDNAYDVD